MKCRKLEDGKWHLIVERPSDILFIQEFKEQLDITVEKEEKGGGE